MLCKKGLSRTQAKNEKKIQRITLPSKATVFITFHCNYRCPYCYLPDKLFPKTKNIIEVLRLLSLKGITTVSILGGEPFLFKKRLIRIIKFCSRNKMTVASISTNGSIINDEILRLISKQKIPLQVSLDAANLKTYKKIRQSTGFNRILSNIKKMKEKGCKIILSMVLTCFNYKEIPEFAELAKKLGIQTVSLGSFIPIGRGENVKDWLMNDKQILEAWKLIKKTSKKIEILGIGEKECSAIKKEIDILPDGSVYPCALFFSSKRAKLGNIFDKQLDLNKIWARRFLAYKISEKCLNCGIPSICYKPCKAYIYSYRNLTFECQSLRKEK